MTNEQILNIFEGLNLLVENKIPLNIKTSYILAKDKKIITEFYNLIDEKRIELYKKYGKVQDDGTINIPKENFTLLENDLKELFQIENKIPITKIKLEDLGNENINIDIIEKLLPIIIDE